MSEQWTHITNYDEDKAEKLVSEYKLKHPRNKYRIDDPKPTEECTVESLIEWNLCGISFTGPDRGH